MKTLIILLFIALASCSTVPVTRVTNAAASSKTAAEKQDTSTADEFALAEAQRLLDEGAEEFQNGVFSKPQVEVTLDEDGESDDDEDDDDEDEDDGEHEGESDCHNEENEFGGEAATAVDEATAAGKQELPVGTVGASNPFTASVVQSLQFLQGKLPKPLADLINTVIVPILTKIWKRFHDFVANYVPSSQQLRDFLIFENFETQKTIKQALSQIVFERKLDLSRRAIADLTAYCNSLRYHYFKHFKAYLGLKHPIPAPAAPVADAFDPDVAADSVPADAADPVPAVVKEDGKVVAAMKSLWKQICDFLLKLWNWFLSLFRGKPSVPEQLFDSKPGYERIADIFEEFGYFNNLVVDFKNQGNYKVVFESEKFINIHFNSAGNVIELVRNEKVPPPHPFKFTILADGRFVLHKHFNHQTWRNNAELSRQENFARTMEHLRNGSGMITAAEKLNLANAIRILEYVQLHLRYSRHWLYHENRCSAEFLAGNDAREIELMVPKYTKAQMLEMAAEKNRQMKALKALSARPSWGAGRH